MAVRIIKEAAFDKNFNDRMDKEWARIHKGVMAKSKEITKKYNKQKSDLINNYYKKLYDNSAFDIKEINGGKGRLIIDKVTGKLIMNRVRDIMKDYGFNISVDRYSTKERDIADNIENTLSQNEEDLEANYNGAIKATKVQVHNLSFNKDSNGKSFGRDSQYKCYLDLSVYIRSGLAQEGEFDEAKLSELFEVLVVSNILGFKAKNDEGNFEILKSFRKDAEAYKSVMDAIQRSITQVGTEAYWNVEEKNSFQGNKDDFIIVKNKRSK